MHSYVPSVFGDRSNITLYTYLYPYVISPWYVLIIAFRRIPTILYQEHVMGSAVYWPIGMNKCYIPNHSHIFRFPHVLSVICSKICPHINKYTHTYIIIYMCVHMQYPHINGALLKWSIPEVSNATTPVTWWRWNPSPSERSVSGVLFGFRPLESDVIKHPYVECIQAIYGTLW